MDIIKNVFSMMTSKATYFFIFIILGLGVFLMYQNSLIQSSKHKIEILGTQITSLEKDNLVLETSLEKANIAREVENKLLEQTREEVNKLRSEKEVLIGKVENVFKDKNNINSPLPSDLVRVLNNACESVSSNPCAYAK